MIYLVLEWSCTTIALAAFLYRLITLPRDRLNPAPIALAVYFFSSFVSFVVGLEPIAGRLAELSGFRNVTIIVSHAAVIVLTAAQQVVLIYWADPPEKARWKARRRVLAFGVVLVVLITMFLAILPQERRGTSETSSLLNMHNPSFAVYLVVFTATAAVGQAITLRMSWRYAKVVGDGWLRRSMWLVAAGAVLILGYCTLRLAQVVGAHVGIDMSPWNPMQWLFGDIGSLLEIVGWTIPGWGPVLFGAAQWMWYYRQHQRLRPLWVALHQATPEIALDASSSRWTDRVLVRDLSYRRYRRMIEIMDGLRALRPFLDPRIRDEASRVARQVGMPDRRLESILDGVELHAALQARAATGSLPTDSPAASVPDADDDLAGEARRLVALATSFRRAAPFARRLVEQSAVPEAHS